MKSQDINRTRLGDILLKKGLITNDQLQFAIDAQKNSPLQLGEILIEKKWVSQWQINRALQVQSKLRNAVLTSILSLSPLALVGCGGASESSPEQNPVPSEQVIGELQGEDGAEEDASVNPIDDSAGSEGVSGGVAVVQDDDAGAGSVDAGSGDDSLGGAEQSNPDQDNDTPQEVSSGAVQFSWAYPTHRTDGSDFEVYQVKNFRIYQVSEEGDVDTVYEVDALDTDYKIEALSQGQYHFSITVVDTEGLESGFSETVSVSI